MTAYSANRKKKNLNFYFENLKETFGRSRCRREDNVTIDLEEIHSKRIEYIHLNRDTFAATGESRLNAAVKADSHIACRAHAVPLPCRAAKGLECVFPI